MRKQIYNIADQYGSNDYVVCDKHAKVMPIVDGYYVQAFEAESDCVCSFCEEKVSNAN